MLLCWSHILRSDQFVATVGEADQEGGGGVEEDPQQHLRLAKEKLKVLEKDNFEKDVMDLDMDMPTIVETTMDREARRVCKDVIDDVLKMVG
jgi:hypothetical protein